MILELHNIKRHYEQAGSILPVLSELNLSIAKGEMVALVGQSGSGKTTLLQIAGLLDAPSSGQVVIANRDMSSANDANRTIARRSLLGFVYQFHHLLPEFSALENIMLPQMIVGISQSEAHVKSEKLLADFGLSARANHRPAKLSGGEQQRVAIARALANSPALLLADEPTGNLDPETAAHVFEMLTAQVKSRGLSALVATHNLELARRMDRIVRLEGGTLV